MSLPVLLTLEQVFVIAIVWWDDFDDLDLHVGVCSKMRVLTWAIKVLCNTTSCGFVVQVVTFVDTRPGFEIVSGAYILFMT